MLELIAVMWCNDKFHRSWYGCPRHKRPCVAAKVSCFLIEHQTNHSWLFKRDQKHTCFGKLIFFKDFYTKLFFSQRQHFWRALWSDCVGWRFERGTLSNYLSRFGDVVLLEEPVLVVRSDGQGDWGSCTSSGIQFRSGTTVISISNTWQQHGILWHHTLSSMQKWLRLDGCRQRSFFGTRTPNSFKIKCARWWMEGAALQRVNPDGIF